MSGPCVERRAGGWRCARMETRTRIGTETIVGREGWMIGDDGGGCVEQAPVGAIEGWGGLG